ncbi:hypothetical protein EMCRGX_G033622 [Ephydatia muelleri]
MGSVYVFNLPDMRLHHHLHLQDAVLSLCALNGCGVHYGGDEMKYRVLLGLANGTIILFFGINQGKVVPNPLQGPKLQMFTTGRKPCLNMCPTSNGYIWCSCGDSLELLDIVSLKSLRKLDALVVAIGGSETPRGLRKGEVMVIMLMATNALGVWTVTRRSTLLRLWDAVTGAMKASYNVRNVLAGEDHDITALMTHGAALWLGTRTGYILLLDPSALVDGQNPLLGLQYCGKGKVKFIRPLVSPNKPTSKLEVVCSVEYEDEVSGVLLAWENVLAGEDHDITALMAHGAALWLGTRTGYILLLDPSALVDGQNPLLGLQYCGKGKVKFIRPLVSPNKPTSKLEELDAFVVAIGGSETPGGLRKGEVIMLMATNALGVWTVTRRSTLLRLWDAVTGAMKASYNVR